MRWYAKAAVGLLGLVPCSGWAEAAVTDSPDKPYQAIVMRNVFRLQPPPERAVDQPPPVALPRMFLGGITTMLNGKRALLQIAPVPGRDPKSQAHSCILMEGQRFGDLEMLEINEKKGSVKLSYAGSVVSLTLEKDAPSARAAPTTPPLPEFVPPRIPGPVHGNATVPRRDLAIEKTGTENQGT